MDDGNMTKGLLTFGISTVGSLLVGKFKKSRSKLPNDMIPVTNGTMFGGGSAIASGGDPVTTLSGFAGAVAASYIHKLLQKMFG